MVFNFYMRILPLNGQKKSIYQDNFNEKWYNAFNCQEKI